MKRVIFKTRSMGYSSLAIPGDEFMFQLVYLVLYVPNTFSAIVRKHNPAVLIGQVSLVEFQKPLMKEVAKPLNASVIPKRFADVIDGNSGILAARVWDEKNSIDRDSLRGNVKQPPVWSLPNGMQLCFDQNLFPLQDIPAYTLFSTVTGNMLWNDRETFVQWLAGQRLDRDVKRLAAWSYAPAKTLNVAV